MTTTSWKISDTLFLVQQTVDSKAPQKPSVVPVNHIAVIDCSGSMSGDLPRIREQLKMKLPEILSENDTLSVVWFSGRGQFGVAMEGVSVATVKDLKGVYAEIDRNLRPVGLTGFKEPIEEVKKLAGRLSKKNEQAVASLFFMSDGCDNQWDRSDILKAVESASGVLASATFVEYGYYADRPLLTSMAQKAGGSLIFSQDFESYAPQFEAMLQKRVSGAPRIEVKIGGDPVGGFAFAIQGKDLLTFDAKGSVHVPQDLGAVYYLSPSSIGTNAGELLAVSKMLADGKIKSDSSIDAAYAAVSLYSIRGKSDIVYPMLRALGDVMFIETFAGCFGKQKYSDYMELSKNAALGVGRYAKGWDPNKVPRDDAFTVLDMLRVLSEDNGNRVLLDDSRFKYSRIGRGRVDAHSVLTDEEQAEIQALTSQMAGEKDVKKLKEIQTRIAAITDSKGESLRFEENKSPNGYSISSLTFNEERPNISILVRKEGTVDVSKKLPDQFKGNQLGKVPEKFPTFVFRNYAIVKDGLVNVKSLPVALSDSTKSILEEKVRSGDIPKDVVSFESGNNALISLDQLPVINRKMVKEVSAKTLFELEFELTKARASQKVYNSYKKEKLPTKKSDTYEAIYGKEAADWLKEQGFTDYSGFSPKTVQAESTDFYLGKELKISIKGYSTIPSLNDYRKGKRNGPANLMTPAVDDVENFLKSDVYTKAKNPDEAFESWIDARCEEATAQTRKLIFQMAQIKFSIVVGQVWPSEFKNIEENSLSITAGDLSLDCKLDMREIQVKI